MLALYQARKIYIVPLILLAILFACTTITLAQTKDKKQEFPLWEKVRQKNLKKNFKVAKNPLQEEMLSGNAFSSKFPNQEAFERFVQEGWDSPYGLDYFFVLDPRTHDPQVIDLYGETVGIRWVNFAKVGWDQLEKKKPLGDQHFYNWALLDKGVRLWQKHGVHIMMSLRVRNPWGTQPPTDKEFVYQKGLARKLVLATTDYLPKPKYMEAYREFISSLVERYDGDGIDDMPGLLFPVLYYQLGNEYYNEVYWAGTAEEYGILLKETKQAARKANRNVKIILSGVGFEEIYGFYDKEMEPETQKFVGKYLPRVPKNMKDYLRRGEDFSIKTLQFCDDYDIFDARWPNYGIIAKWKELLATHGCGDKAVWSAEIYSIMPLMEPLVLPNWTLQAIPTPSKSRTYLKIIKSIRHKDFAEINGWYRAMQAAWVVKMTMAALDAGSDKLMMGWFADYQTPIAVSTLSHHGLYSATLKKLWPAGYTYKQIIEKLEGVRSVRRLSMPENIYVYECIVKGGKKVLVAFYDDHIGQNHDEPLGEIAAKIPYQGSAAQVTHIIKDMDQDEPVVARVEVNNGLIRLKLSEYPVFIE